MTRDQITTLVTGTVGQTDATSVSICNDYVQRAYEMVWNAEVWRDTVTIDTSPTITQGTNTFALPANFDRIVSLQLLSGGVPVDFLDPTTSSFIFQTERNALTTQGVPTKYEEFVHTDGTRKIRVFPVPNAAYTFTLSGKRTCPILSGSDGLQIRNVDNAVIALATSDMYTRLRQLGKAAEMAKKAGAFIDEARKIEQEQSAKPRIAKALTVTVNSLSELADAVCSRSGEYTPDSVILAKDFLRRRYRMIWDSFLWKDSVTTVDSATVNAQSYIAMPAGLERAISVVVNGTMMEPIDSAYLMQTNPTISTKSGVPTVFEEYDVSGSKRIKLLPIPDGVYTVTVAGKKTVTNLTADTDVPAIRNIDNALIAFAVSDLHALRGRVDQSKAALDEGTAEVQAARTLESQQTVRARMAKPLTVAGNSLLEMADAVCVRTDQWTLDAQIIAKEFLRRNYQQVYDSNPWAESTVVLDVTSVTSVLLLPAFVDRVISIRGNAKLGQLSAVQPSLYFGINPWIFEQTGDPLAFAYLTSVAVTVLPTSAQQLTLVSTNAADKSNVFVRGEQDDGTVVTETVALNGLTPVNTGKSYLIPLTIAKNITVGTVAVTGSVSMTQYVALGAAERERKHMRIQFQPTPPSNVTCKVLCKRRFAPLLSDEDTPMLRDIGNVLINLAAADMFSKIGNKDGALDARTKADEALKTLISLEVTQGAMSPQIVPEVEPYGYGWDDSYDMAFIAKV